MGILWEFSDFLLDIIGKKIDTSITTVFKSTGMAVFDLFVAEALYKAAEEKNCGTIVSL